MNTVQKFLILVVIVALVWVAYYFASYKEKMLQVREFEGQFQQVQKEFDSKKKIASDLPRFEAEVAQLRTDLNKSQSQLPPVRNIPAIVEEIYNAANNAGVTVKKFSPGSEVVRGFYAEIILSIELQGGFHNLAVFFDKLGKLERIINVGQLSLSAPRTTDKGMELSATCNLITYRFLGGEVKPKEVAQK